MDSNKKEYKKEIEMYNKKFWIRVLLPLCLLAMLSWSGTSWGVELDREKLEKLERGEPVVWLEREGELAGRVVGMILIDATVEDSWKFLANWDTNGPCQQTGVYYRTVHRSDNRSIIVGSLRILFMRANYTLDVTFDKENKKQSWRQLSDEEVERYKEMGVDAVKANLTRDIGGYQRLEPHGEKTLLIYSPFIEIKLPIPGFIENFLMRAFLPGHLRAVRKGIEGGGI